MGPSRAKQRIVLGLDPGSRRTGFGIVRPRTEGLERVASGVIRLDEKRPFAARLPKLRDGVVDVITSFHPTEAVLETCFVGRSARAALVLGHVRGVLLMLCLDAGLEVFEYAPAEIKRAATGQGNAPKEQVQEMLRRLILRIPERLVEDESDALATAYCHLSRPPVALPRPIKSLA